MLSLSEGGRGPLHLEGTVVKFPRKWGSQSKRQQGTPGVDIARAKALWQDQARVGSR